MAGALGGLRECCRYDDAIPLAIAAMLEWGGSGCRYWSEMAKLPNNDWLATLRDCAVNIYHGATAPTLYLAMRAACLAAIGAQNGK